MSLIDNTYFAFEPLYIPNASTNTAGISQKLATDKSVEITRLIAKREKEYLVKMLGLKIYNLFTVGLAASPTIEQKWVDLRDKFIDSTNKLSPIANYCYCYYLRNKPTTDVGVVSQKVENAILLDPSFKIVDVWNDMVQQNYDICQWLVDNCDTYEDEENDILLPLYVENYGLLGYTNTFGI
jgi:hypothetical protein